MTFQRLGLLGVLGIVTYVVAASDFNPIAAVTSASGRFKINGGSAYATYADVNWWDFYNNGSQHTLKYGTSTAYGSSINLKPFAAGANITTRIPNLQPGTKYYIQFYRPYQGRDYMTNGTFTTYQATSAITPPKPDAAPALDLRDKIVEAYLPSGRLVASLRVGNPVSKVTLDRSVINDCGLRSGAYVFVVKDPQQGTVISTIRKAVIK